MNDAPLPKIRLAKGVNFIDFEIVEHHRHDDVVREIGTDRNISLVDLYLSGWVLVSSKPHDATRET